MIVGNAGKFFQGGLSWRTPFSEQCFDCGNQFFAVRLDPAAKQVNHISITVNQVLIEVPVWTFGFTCQV
jgi:hypothetical protein